MISELTLLTLLLTGVMTHLCGEAPSSCGDAPPHRKLFAAWPVECEKVMEECYGNWDCTDFLSRMPYHRLG